MTAKRVRRLLLELAGAVSPRTVRRYVAALRRRVTSKEAFVHRSVAPGTTMEVDFGESWVDISGVPCKVKYLVATLPYSNAYFAKAYPVERLESLLDAIESAFRYFRGIVDRVVLDNTSLAVKDVLAGRDRVQTEAFEGFRGAYPFRAEFCAPAKGWEKGSVENGVKYVRNLVFRPRLAVESWAALNATILTELEADLPTRHLDDGRSAQEALTLERQHLRAMPAYLPATCRVVARVADKFGHVRVDKVTYSVPIRYAYQPVWVKLYHDRVATTSAPTWSHSIGGRSAGARRSSMRFTCCRCWNASTGPWPRRRPFCTGVWRRSGRRCGTSWRNTPASPIRSGSEYCG